MLTYLVPLIVSFLAAFAMVPAVQRLARRVGAIDVPRSHLQIHRRPTPRLGGVAIFTGFLLAVLASVLWGGLAEVGLGHELLPILAGAMMMLALGMVDDIRGVQPHHRFFVQVPAAVLLIAFGTRVNIPSIPALSVALTIFYVVGSCNSLNLLDGIDGLAAGVTAIAAAAFGILFFRRGDVLGVILSVGLVGSALGFLWYNFSPASIFLGDSGSLFLGFLLAVLAIRFLQIPSPLMAYLVPVAILGLPIFDTGLTVIRRIINAKALLPGDRHHSYDKLMAHGLKSRQTVLLMYGMGMIFAATGLLFSRFSLMQALPLITLELIGLSFLVRKFGMLHC